MQRWSFYAAILFVLLMGLCAEAATLTVDLGNPQQVVGLDSSQRVSNLVPTATAVVAPEDLPIHSGVDALWIGGIDGD